MEIHQTDPTRCISSVRMDVSADGCCRWINTLGSIGRSSERDHRRLDGSIAGKKMYEVSPAEIDLADMILGRLLLHLVLRRKTHLHRSHSSPTTALLLYHHITTITHQQPPFYQIYHHSSSTIGHPQCVIYP